MFWRPGKARDKQSRNTLTGGDEWMTLRALEPRVLLDAAAATTAANATQHEQQPPPPPPDPSAELVQALAQATAPAPPPDPIDAPPATEAIALAPHATVADAAAQPAAVYFIDRAIPEVEQLATALGPNAEVHFIDTSRDGVQQIADALAGRSNIDAVHILSHGESGSLRLGNATLDAASMQGEYRDELQAISRALSTNGDILIYGCDFAQSGKGEQAVQLLAEITAADVAATNDTTGAERFGGDWTLEYASGSIESAAVSAPEWDHVMIAPVVNTASNVVSEGSFEGGTGTWTAQSGAVERQIGTTFGFAAFDGSAYIEVEGAVGSTYVEQVVTVVPGQEYQLSWYGRTRTNYAATGADLGTATITGVSGGDISQGFTTARATWTRFTTTFTAVGTSVTIRFTSNGNTAGSNATDGIGLVLDNVRLAPTNFSTSYTEGGAGIAIATTDSEVRDIDSNITSMTVVITNGQAGDMLSATGLPAGITASFNAGTYTLTLTGTTTAANYQTALRAVRFSSVSESPSTTPRVLNVTANDGAASSTAAVTTIDVLAVDDAPVVDLNSGTTPTEQVTNGNFGGTTASTAGWTVAGNGAAGGASGNSTFRFDDATSATLTQSTITGWNDGLAPSGSAQLSVRIGWGNSPVDISTSATLTISVGGVVYARLTTGAALTPGANTGTFTYFNGATGNLSTLQATTAGGGFATLLLDLPSSVATTGSLVFTYAASAIGGDPISLGPVSVLRRVDSTPGVNFSTAFTENGAAVSIADTDSDVRDVDSANMVSATIVLTNAQAGDLLTPGALPAGISAAVDTSVAGQITVTLTGSATKADYNTANGTALTGAAQSIAVPNGTVTIDATGAITFTPALDYNGPVSFDYVIGDAAGLQDSGSVNIDVTAGNDAPVAGDDSYSTPEDTPLAINLLPNDSDADGDPLHIASINGTTLTPGVPQNSEVPNGTLQINAAGAITFMPAANFNGTLSFDYVVADPDGGTDSGTVSITVTPVNDAPSAAGDLLTEFLTPEDTAFPLNLLTNAADVDGDVLHIASINGVELTSGAQVIVVPNGTVNIDAAGAISFTPAPNYNGPVTFSYEVADPSDLRDTGFVNISVTPVNDAPVAANDSTTTAEDSPLALSLLANDSDIDGDTLHIASINAVALTGGAQTIAVPNGTVSIDSAGAISFTPAANYNGPVSFDYVMADPAGLQDTGTVSVDVTPVNDPPVALDDSASVAPGASTSGQVLANDSDADGDPLSVTQIDVDTNGDGQPESYPVPPGGNASGTLTDGAGSTIGTLSMDSTGNYVFTPGPTYQGPVPLVRVWVSDGQAGGSSNLRIGDVVQQQVTPKPTDPTLPPPPPWVQNVPDTGTASAASMPPLTITGAVLDAINDVTDLSGMETLGGSGAVLRAVNEATPLWGIDERSAAAFNGVQAGGRFWNPLGAGDALDGDIVESAASALSPDGHTSLQMLSLRERVWVDVNNVEGNGRIVRTRVTMADGSALPPWARSDGLGRIYIDRPANVDRLGLLVVVERADGSSSSYRVDVELNSFQLRVRTDNGNGTQQRAQALPLDFAAQLERGATRSASPVDQELMAALG